MGKEGLETERLLLRRWIEADKAPFATMNRDPEVMRYFTKTLSAEESDSLVERIERSFRERGYGLWAAERKSDGRFLGFIGLNYTDFKSEFTPCVEIGWRLSQDAWGCGYATEGASRCLEHAFRALDIGVIYSFTSALNLRSEKVMKRIGLEKAGEFEHPNIAASDPLCRHLLYRLTKEEYAGKEASE
jgi:[ribosomal protein S5]-alanine N-acetyltransferase